MHWRFRITGDGGFELRVLENKKNQSKALIVVCKRAKIICQKLRSRLYFDLCQSRQITQKNEAPYVSFFFKSFHGHLK